MQHTVVVDGLSAKQHALQLLGAALFELREADGTVAAV
jgi:hypothetical protein